MASYSTQYEITVADLAEAAETREDPDELLRHAEEMVRATLEGAPRECGDDVPSGDTRIGWLARLPAVPATRHLPPRPERFVTWDPSEPLPHGADAVICRGRRTG